MWHTFLYLVVYSGLFLSTRRTLICTRTLLGDAPSDATFSIETLSDEGGVEGYPSPLLLLLLLCLLYGVPIKYWDSGLLSSEGTELGLMGEIAERDVTDGQEVEWIIFEDMVPCGYLEPQWDATSCRMLRVWPLQEIFYHQGLEEDSDGCRCGRGLLIIGHWTRGISHRLFPVLRHWGPLASGYRSPAWQSWHISSWAPSCLGGLIGVLSMTRWCTSRFDCDSAASRSLVLNMPDFLSLIFSRGVGAGWAFVGSW